MNYTSDEDKELSIGVKSDKRCFICDVPIYLKSKEAVTPGGKPTKDVFTRKAIPLDPFRHKQHVCKPEDISAYRETDQYKRTVTEWKNRQQQKENFGSTNSNGISPCNESTNKNNDNSNTNLDLEKILNSISHTNAAVLEQIQTDHKADISAINKDITAIKIALKIGTDRSPSLGEVQA